MDALAFRDFLRQPQNSDRRFELIDGAIVEKLSTEESGFILANIATAIGIFLQSHPLCWVASRVEYWLPHDPLNYRLIDVSVIVPRRPLIDDGPSPFIPPLCVDIQGEGESLKKMVDSAAFYLANGAKMVWLVYPSRQLIEALTATDRQFFGIENTLTAGDLLPGFSVEVRRLFPSV